jgi:ABC-type transport system involved in multi-copper enzyme maturation permease subunit
MITALRSLTDLVVDNPIIMKDGVLALRRKKTLIAFAIAATAVAVISTLVWLDESHALTYSHNAGKPIGGDLFMVMLGLALVASAVVVPGLSSSSISGEREHGTLPLLTVTGLSPGRIVFGKIAANVVLALPFVALTLPPMLAGAVSAGLNPFPVLVALLALPMALVAFAAVGVFASSLTERSRTSAPGALVAAGVPAMFIVMPVFIACANTVDNRLRPEAVALALGSMALGLVVAAGGAYGAWSALAPRSAPRFKKATLLTLAVVLGLPAVSVALASVDWEFLIEGTRPLHRHDLIGPMLVASGLFSATAVLFYAAGLGRDRRAPSPALMVPAMAVLAFSSLFVAMLIVVGPGDASPNHREVAGGIAGVLQMLTAACVASAMGRFIKTAPLAAMLGGGLTLALILVPAVLDEIVVGSPPLAFLNFAYAANANLFEVVVFWSTLSLGALAVASYRRR